MSSLSSPFPSDALVPNWTRASAHPAHIDSIATVFGSLLLVALAQIAVPLSFTPVPVTGQTFGVAVLALGWGRKRAVAAFALYLVEGAIGFHAFALGRSAFPLGPTSGYLVGMGIACFVVGALADRGFTRTPGRALLAAYAGSVCVFGAGLFGLSFFVARERLFAEGMLPFLAGDALKNISAAFIVTRFPRPDSSRNE